MFFTASKVIWWMVQPSTVAFVLVVTGLGLLAFVREPGLLRRCGVVLGAVGAALLFAAGYTPLSNVLLQPLERRFEVLTPQTLKGPVDGIIILGGFEDFGAGVNQAGLPINHAAERLTEGVRLARRHERARVVFTGAVVVGLDTSTSLADAIAAYLRDMGIADQRIAVDRSARNTFENATRTKALVQPKAGETWVLITSGYHMPRSVGVFRAAGFDVVPYPVDLRTVAVGGRLVWFDRLSSGLHRFDMVMREYLGLLAYWLTGRTNALFPGPEAGGASI